MIVHYVGDLDMIFHFKVAQNLVAEHDERAFNMIFHNKFVKYLVAEH